MSNLYLQNKISMSEREEDNTNLYTVLERGDRKIDAIYESAIILVGLTRAGKSTTFNWILGKHLIGVGEDLDAHYENAVDNDLETAELGDTYTSVTLCPNTSKFDRAEGISLIDMAGYEDKRNYIGVLGVSYFLKAVFEKIKRAKFLIVLSEDKLQEKEGSGIINTFSGFIKMFHADSMPPDVKAAFYSSTSLIITRSENPTKHKNYLARISKQIKDPKLNIEKAAEIIPLIDYLIDRNRIEAFRIAVAHVNAPKCDFIQRFNSMGWQFFNIRDIETTLGTQLIALPFKKDFEDLKHHDRDKLDQAIKQRVKSYVEFSKILNTLIRSIQNKWNSAIQQWAIEGQFSLNLSTYSDLFAEMSNFLDNNDAYSSQNLIPKPINIEYKPLNLVKTIKTVLMVYEVTDQIGDQSETFLKNMETYSILFEKLINCLLSFASTTEEEHMVQRLTFVIKRGFRQFGKLYQINSDAIHDVSQKMKDNCNLIFEDPRKDFIERFVNRIDVKLMDKLFANLEDLLEYQDFFNNYELKYRREFSQFTFFSEHRCNIEICKARLWLYNNNKRKVLRSYIAAFKNISEIAFQANRSYKPQLEIERQLNELYMKKLDMIHKITDTLKNIKDTPEARIYGLTLCTHVKNIDEACSFYEIIIEESQVAAEKIEKLGEYADYCLDWGRFEKATTLLQKKLILEKESFENYMTTIRKMTSVATSQARHLQQYIENLSNWTRLPEEDKILESYLEELELIFPDQ